MIRPGFVADIAVFDPAAVADRSTYMAGRTLAEGVDHVLVNGTLVLENGEPTGATAGARGAGDPAEEPGRDSPDGESAAPESSGAILDRGPTH